MSDDMHACVWERPRYCSDWQISGTTEVGVLSSFSFLFSISILISKIEIENKATVWVF